MAPDSKSKKPSPNSDPVILFDTFQDRQKYVRSSVYIDAQLLVGDQTIECMVLNISYSGARVQVSQQLLPESDLILRVDDFDDLPCKVVRQNGENLGLGFIEPTTKTSKMINDILGNETNNENREFPRRGVLFKANYHTGIRIHACKIIDISLGGMCVKSDKYFRSEKMVTIETLRFGSFSCQLAWQKETLLGLEFLDEPHKIREHFGHILPQT